MNPQVPLGECVPPSTQYAVSVSLPMWEDNVDYEKGDSRVVDRMVSGYPRFFIAKPIQALVTVVKDKFALPNETAMIFPSLKCADRCVAFIYDQAPKQQGKGLEYVLPRPGQVRIVTHVVEPINKKAAALDATTNVLHVPVAIYCVLFPEDLFPLAKQYWQHTGDGISARLADHCLHIARVNEEFEQETIPFSSPNIGGASRRKQGSGYHRTPSSVTSPSSSTVSTPVARSLLPAAGKSTEAAKGDSSLFSETKIEADTFVEERFGRNLSLKYSTNMKAALRRRIAGALSEEEQKQGAQVERGVAGLSADDVFVATTGMGAIFQAHQALLRTGRGKSVCFGFSYTDTLKVLEKFGPGAYFLGHGEGADYDELEQILDRHATSSEEEPILAIFTECPSNPLLKTADLSRLRSLADRYGAALVVDETIGSFPNVDVLSWADIVVSSLTKVFSGDSNVMGGSIVLNPNRAHYARLRATMDAEFEDLLWCEDAVFLERNSRDFMSRVPQINANALAVAQLLVASPKVTQVNYPKFTTPANYELIKRKTADAGYGGLLSVVFAGGESASRIFYDSLSCCKGPSLGTNFTLASPYTILAHFTELDWAAKYGVSPHLVRISVGLEPHDELLAMFQSALDAIPA